MPVILKKNCCTNTVRQFFFCALPDGMLQKFFDVSDQLRGRFLRGSSASSFRSSSKALRFSSPASISHVQAFIEDPSGHSADDQSDDDGGQRQIDEYGQKNDGTVSVNVACVLVEQIDIQPCFLFVI
ncbi:MAG: hypothetical protein Q4F96_01415 [Bacillota bacterium]|nr:hypothetical protein [Bacillota bacterium]